MIIYILVVHYTWKINRHCDCLCGKTIWYTFPMFYMNSNTNVQTTINKNLIILFKFDCICKKYIITMHVTTWVTNAGYNMSKNKQIVLQFENV